VCPEGTPPRQFSKEESGRDRRQVMTVYLCNSFTLSMIMPDLLDAGVVIKASPITLEEARTLLQQGFVSAVGHESTAKVLSSLLGMEVPFNRVQIAITGGDVIVSFQLLIRLPEGKVLGEDEVMALYKEGKIKFFRVEVLPPTEKGLPSTPAGEALLNLYDAPARLYQERECDLCGEIARVIFFCKIGEWDIGGGPLAICRKCMEAILASSRVDRMNYCICGG
jgi:hypothetical protein